MPIFDDKVITGVRRHMNGEHTNDSLLIVQGLGNTPKATAATVDTLDNDGIVFAAIVNDQPTSVRVPFSERLEERPQLRVELTRMYQDACVVLGVTARNEGEH